MKITIDTTNKVIKVEERVNLNDLISEVKRLLPEEWIEYSIDAWGETYYPYYPSYPTIYPSYPASPQWAVTCESTAGYRPDMDQNNNIKEEV